MIRMPLTWLRPRTLFSILPAVLLLAWLTLAGSPALACTTEELQRTPETGTAKTSPNQGLKLRTRHQNTVFQGHLASASLAPPAVPVFRLAEADPIPSSDPRTRGATQGHESSSAHSYQPLAMLGAALVLMISIALRRSGKR